MNEKVGRLTHIIIDGRDTDTLANFWSSVLGLELAEPTPPYQDLVPESGGAPIISFQKVSEVKSGKNRVHLDVKVDDLGVAEARIRKIGGNVLRRMNQDGFEWTIAADPEGNEFCHITTIE